LLADEAHALRTAAVAALFARHRGNLRDALLASYDAYATAERAAAG